MQKHHIVTPAAPSANCLLVVEGMWQSQLFIGMHASSLMLIIHKLTPVVKTVCLKVVHDAYHPECCV